ncbi:transposable element Tcb1 transposase [Trichonephila clavipes]|nr:transposable element Tcb1 transposase [Trichonephila clavipes]
MREISQRVEHYLATFMRIFHRWMQEETANRRGQSHLPRCTTTRDNRWIVSMAVMNSLAISQWILSVMHHSVSTRTIRHRLQQTGMSVRYPLLRLTLKLQAFVQQMER